MLWAVALLAGVTDVNDAAAMGLVEAVLAEVPTVTVVAAVAVLAAVTDAAV